MATKSKKQPQKTQKHKPMTTAEAGKKGGTKVLETYGHEFFSEIGKKGGAKVKAAFAALKKSQANA